MPFREVGAGDLLSGYRLLERLGEGGFGSVWKAEDRPGGAWVALKIPRSPESLGWLRREAALQRRLDHPGIVKTLGIELLSDPPFLVLEYVAGPSLRRLMSEDGILPPLRAIELSVQVCEALSFAHARGILHKDIKPENLLLEPLAGPGRSAAFAVKVADLGLGHALEATASAIFVSAAAPAAAAPVAGTVFYMAPEQRAPHRALDARSDLYSLGVVLYEALTGELPLGMSLPSELNPVVSPELDAVCKRALSLDRDRRYRSAQEMAADLRRARAAYAAPRPVGGAGSKPPPFRPGP